jgi:signal peptidase I
VQDKSMGILQKFYAILVDTIETVLFAASIFLVIYIFLFRPFQVNGSSMYPTFYNEEYILTNLIGLRFNPPTTGDVIVFKAPIDAEKDFIKRVIGVPGDRVYVKDGDVYINGKKFDESAYLSSEVKTYPGAFLKEGKEIVVPQNNYIVFGDNRGASSDSREWGFVPSSSIIGESFIVYWPPSRFQVIKNPIKK